MISTYSRLSPCSSSIIKVIVIIYDVSELVFFEMLKYEDKREADNRETSYTRRLIIETYVPL